MCPLLFFPYLKSTLSSSNVSALWQEIYLKLRNNHIRKNITWRYWQQGEIKFNFKIQNCRYDLVAYITSIKRDEFWCMFYSVHWTIWVFPKFCNRQPLMIYYQAILKLDEICLVGHPYGKRHTYKLANFCFSILFGLIL